MVLVERDLATCLTSPVHTLPSQLRLPDLQARQEVPLAARERLTMLLPLIGFAAVAWHAAATLARWDS